MLTENQQIKVGKIFELYSLNKEPIDEVNEAKVIEILRKNKWNITNSIQELNNYHNQIIAEKIRISNLPNNVVRPSDFQGHDEIWCKFYKCPNCRALSLTDCKENYCSNCGTKVDWSEFK